MPRIDPKRRDRLLAAAIAAGATHADAARTASCSRKTVVRRLRDPAFRRQIEEARREILDRIAGKTTEAAEAGVAVLKEIALDGDGPRSVRVSAARALLELTLKLRESLQVVERLEELEQRLLGLAGGGPTATAVAVSATMEEKDETGN